MQSNTVHPCDERLPAGQLLTLGIQHVLVMYAGAVAVPLIIGSALKLPKDQIAFLISADLFSCGIATLIQTLGLWIFGIRLPVIMGCTFAAVGPMIAIGTNPSLGILDIFGSTIAAGIVGILLAPAIGKLLRFFPPVVVGVVISVIGLSLMEVGINWAAGGVGNPDYGNPVYLGLSFVVLMLILLINKFGKGFVANISVLLGIVAGFVIAALLGRVNMEGVTAAPWVGFVMPFHFGLPHFDPLSIATMVTVMFVTFIESTGMFLAVGDMVDRPVDQKTLVRGLRVDGLGTLLGGWRIVRTMGLRITRLTPMQGFCAETGGAATLFMATFLGVPVSTTHTITGAIVGVGAARRVSAVRWNVASSIVYAWVITVPASALVAALAYWAVVLLQR